MSNNLLKIELQANKVYLIGELTLATIMSQMQAIKNLLTSAILPLQINLEKVTQGDSAGVALLITCVRDARKQNKQITLQNFPKQMLAILQVTGLTKLLPIENV